MRYVEIPIDEAIRKCKKNAKILVAIQDLKDDDVDIVFVQKKSSDYQEVFEDVETVASLCDELQIWNNIQTNVRKRVLTFANECSIIGFVIKQKTNPNHTKSAATPIVLDRSSYISKNSRNLFEIAIKIILHKIH